ncbi:MAG: hypothetical protein R3B90_22880 [Planctomycetaceae bacterium]
MPILRKFFDWNEPLLPQIVDWLCGTFPSGRHVDLSDLILVFPGGLAGRNFSRLLTSSTGGRNDPPEILTPEQLPERLYTPQKPFANELTQGLAWASVLRNLPATSLRSLMHRPPDDDDFQRWLQLGRLIARQHTELAADGLDFADVLATVAFFKSPQEIERWTTLQRGAISVPAEVGRA